jgi:hypothetical protein
MLINPYADKNRATTYAGTRMLEDGLGILGAEVYDPREPLRQWFVRSIYAPIPGRALGGIRARLEDEKGFIAFINQRDLEVSIGLTRPGQWCKWADQPYVDPDDKEWFGICADEDDLLDDLQEREMLLRTYYDGGVLFPPCEIDRRVHVDAHSDFEESFMLLWDMDPETGLGPDPRLETIEARWKRINRERVRWERL